ncbi:MULTISPECIES: efflux RND transporter periplasmic adaptor subunit [unclassified Ensifer]|uniref:efflux RND transporter periplasmic adaptor subunit n=1 Tax=unclassified Ensifer TaxID=2633371 RepID=UPI00081399C0|nr:MULTISPECIES: efflux RND transporter periplasmic adaptor subunit [unclassified Ensifer]OCP05760.1 efflux transporter periplasmic adaptor subunit [Ensifer sp. LC11]OCP06504.1 efflux transporter periplasmic adaptor subunit [Ensifer sp. LC13]OCP06770.1 efflux transporter periplasmic adaptor subunit [Ensifer sp. LC14]OCP31257.1 efflux transporter periplasmic adaptor subunit [Ensifer sp. LC499]
MRGSKLVLAAAVATAALVAAYHYKNGGFELKGGDAGAAVAPAQQAMPVPVAAVVKKTIPIYLDYSARTEAIRNVTLRAKISGYVESQSVPDGADVKEGDLLYRIDARDYRAELDQAKAQVERDEASLAYLRSNLTRGNELATTGYLDKDSFDQRQSAVHQAEAALAMSKAAVRTAEINFDYTEIRAPFAGRLGRNQASEGTLVSSTAGTPLNNLVQLSPIYVSFNPSEAEMTSIQKARAKGNVEAEVLLPGDAEPRYRGALTFINNTIEGNTGTVVARATIDNTDLSLLPGQYVRVRLKVREEPGVLMVPETALGSSQLGKYVYVVGKGDVVEQRLVTPGPTSGNLIGVTSGVSEGDQVISGNLQKIFPGAPVTPMPAEQAQK